MSWFRRKPRPFVDTKIRHTQRDVLGSVRGLTGHFPTVLDSTFTPVDHDWLTSATTQRKLRTHFWGLPRYTSQAFDCENFATELVQWLCREAALAGIPAAPEAYVICVDNKTPWAGIRDGKHALNLIQTDREPIVIEPQSIRNGISAHPFAHYPNPIFKVYT